MDPNPPIGDEEFRDRFYSPEPEDANYVSRLSAMVARYLPKGLRIHQTILPVAAKTTQCQPEFDVIQRLPKRDHRVNENNGSPRDIFFGLYAREVVALRAVLAWVIGLFIIPPLIFFFLWIFEFKHYDQLDAAINPLGVSVSLVGIFFATLWSTRPARPQRTLQ